MGEVVYINFGQLSGKLNKLGPELERRAKRGLRSGALRVVAEVQTQIAETLPYQPVATGVLAASYRSRRTPEGAVVGSDAIQSIFIERGRRPGRMPPIQAIADWVLVKGLYESALPPSKQGKKRVARAVKEAAARSVAFLIARSIGEKGTAPRWLLKRSLLACKGEIESYILAAMRGAEGNQAG